MCAHVFCYLHLCYSFDMFFFLVSLPNSHCKAEIQIVRRRVHRVALTWIIVTRGTSSIVTHPVMDTLIWKWDFSCLWLICVCLVWPSEICGECQYDGLLQRAATVGAWRGAGAVQTEVRCIMQCCSCILDQLHRNFIQSGCTESKTSSPVFRCCTLCLWHMLTIIVLLLSLYLYKGWKCYFHSSRTKPRGHRDHFWRSSYSGEFLVNFWLLYCDEQFIPLSSPSCSFFLSPVLVPVHVLWSQISVVIVAVSVPLNGSFC